MSTPDLETEVANRESPTPTEERLKVDFSANENKQLQSLQDQAHKQVLHQFPDLQLLNNGNVRQSETITTSPNAVSNETTDSTVKDKSKGASNEATDNPSKDKSTDASKENTAASQESNRAPNDKSADASKEKSNGAPNDKSDDASKEKSKEKSKEALKENTTETLSPALKKQVSDLIDKLGNEEFDVREKAQRDLVKLGSPAFDMLKHAAKNNPDLEIRRRSERSARAILNEDPSALRSMRAMKDEALADIQKNGGTLSKESREKYEQFIKNAGDLSMGTNERKARQEFIDKTGKEFNSPPEQQRAASRELRSLSAVRTDFAAQARMDYADALLTAGDKKAAIKVLSEAVTKNPELGKYGGSYTFQKLARESGALDDKAFLTAIEKATGKEGGTKYWNDDRVKVAQDIGSLTEQTARFGMTKELEKKWDDMLSTMEKRSEKEPGLASFLKTRAEHARMEFVDGLTAAGMKERAVQVLEQMVKRDPTLTESAWYRKIARMNEIAKPDKPNTRADGTIEK